MGRRRTLFVTLVMVLALSGAVMTFSESTEANAAVGPAPRLTVSTVLSGLHRPWDLGFTPGGGMLFTERSGPIKFRIGATGQVRQLARPADAVESGEGGMMGVAIDPNFSVNRRVYTCFLSNRSGPLDVRLVRWQINGAVTALVNRTDIVTGIPVRFGRHSGCRPRFGPDGRIWIGTGDAAIPTVPQDPRSLGGKVLRVDTNGKGVAGNASAPFDPRIYTYGHRNVQGLAFSPGGKAYSIEHGTGVDDEVNRLFAGANYGWDPVSACEPDLYDETRPMTDLVRFPGARSAVWSSGNPTIAPSGGTFVFGPRWKGWDRCITMAVLKDQQLRVLCLDGTGMAVKSNTVHITDRGRLRVAVLNPINNDLYIATDADPGSILRVTPG